jgi:hypothetical protein
MGLSYTFGKSIDDMSVDPVGASSSGALTSSGSRAPTDVRNFRLDRSRSDFDNTHVLVVDYLYELPFGRGKKWGRSWPGILNQIAGGWTLTGMYTYESGEPFTILSGSRTLNGGTRVGGVDVVGPVPSSDLKPSSDPTVVGPVAYDVGTGGVGPDPRDPRFKTCQQVIGTQSFFCIPAAGSVGNVGRNSASGTNFWDFDMGVLKVFSINERFRLQFRAEFFNILNHPNFENPRNATTSDVNLRFPNNLLSLDFGQTCCTTASLPSSATIIAVGEPNRVIQFSLKVQF